VKGVSSSSIDGLALTAFATFEGGGPSSPLEAGSSRGNRRRQVDGGGSKAPLTGAPTFEEGPRRPLEESSLNSKSLQLDKIGGKKPFFMVLILSNKDTLINDLQRRGLLLAVT